MKKILLSCLFFGCVTTQKTTITDDQVINAWLNKCLVESPRLVCECLANNNEFKTGVIETNTEKLFNSAKTCLNQLYPE